MPYVKTEHGGYWVDSEGVRRSKWWNSSDESYSGHITEAQFEESRKHFTNLLEERRYSKQVEHIRNLKRVGRIPESYPEPKKPKLLT